MHSISSSLLVVFVFFFFFQAEDGIRDVAVTGVQTCALPIYIEIQVHRAIAERAELRRNRLAVLEQLEAARIFLHRNTHRSEEHTSELQSRLHLVCRLLLEKKKGTRRSAARRQPGE